MRRFVRGSAGAESYLGGLQKINNKFIVIKPVERLCIKTYPSDLVVHRIGISSQHKSNASFGLISDDHTRPV